MSHSTESRRLARELEQAIRNYATAAGVEGALFTHSYVNHQGDLVVHVELLQHGQRRAMHFWMCTMGGWSVYDSDSDAYKFYDRDNDDPVVDYSDPQEDNLHDVSDFMASLVDLFGTDLPDIFDDFENDPEDAIESLNLTISGVVAATEHLE